MKDSNLFSTGGLWGRGLELCKDSIPMRSSRSAVDSKSVADQDLLGGLFFIRKT